jgi:hypothetical protein
MAKSRLTKRQRKRLKKALAFLQPPTAEQKFQQDVREVEEKVIEAFRMHMLTNFSQLKEPGRLGARP